MLLKLYCKNLKETNMEETLQTDIFIEPLFDHLPLGIQTV